MGRTVQSNSTRSGRFEKQPTGYSAFVPHELPPTPPIQMDDEMQALLSKADRALGRLDGSIQTLPNPRLFVFMYVRKEAVLSSQIEGTQSSLNDILHLEASVMRANTPNDASEVVSYINAMNYGLDRLNSLPISTRLIREIHERLMQNVRGQHEQPGEIRTSQNWIGPQGCTLNDAIFVPPPPGDLNRCLGQLDTYIHDESPLPELVKIGLIHAQFETIHPFLDGNGRVGRLLVTFLLCSNEILIQPVLYLSHFFKKNRQEYYEKLQNVRMKGEWEEWLKFFLRGVGEVSLEATVTARSIVELREKFRSIILADFGRTAGNGMLILEQLFMRPILSVQDVAEILGSTYQPANALVERFVKAEMLTEVTGQSRYRMFSFDKYISLFSATSVSQE